MARPTQIFIDEAALLHNLARVQQLAPDKKVLAVVKANAYGCGLAKVLPTLDGHVHGFAVACLEEAMALRSYGCNSLCLLLQGVFDPEELQIVASQRFQTVIHQQRQLQWVLTNPLPTKINVWIKVNTGMNRLGFFPNEAADVIRCLLNCPWVDPEIGLMTHLACADEPDLAFNQKQWQSFMDISVAGANIKRSVANSAVILAAPQMLVDEIRPGIMLYGVSPFANQTGADLGLIPVMRLISAITNIHHLPPFSRVGYAGTWQSDKPSIIGIVPAGYGDGYPRYISPNTAIWINGSTAPIVGRISMDMLTVDLTNCPGVKIGDAVELWGQHIPVETIAKSAKTIAYELLCQVTDRVRV